MSTFLERLIEEREELYKKLAKLDDFINNNPVFKTLHEEQRYLLKVQFHYMEGYYNILTERIDDIEK